ncbi:MAG: alkaline phosphatase [Tannerella sp.]|jgi:alkaline phosphatase|nr:alkaline phosphatase [Tannerella sp.]
MRKILLISVVAVLFVFTQGVFGQAKYVFYFIGDGMGVNYINLTEAYLSTINGERGSGKLFFAGFPVASFATSYSANDDVTDSAAGGTALATGEKTNNGVIGLLPDKKTSIETVAELARKAGKKVGVSSSVPINHATPASFYGHQPDRGMYYEISLDLLKSGFDFFGGAGFYNRDNYYDKSKAPDIYPLIEKAGYTVSKGYDDFKANAGQSKRVVLVQKKWEEAGAIPYSIDRGEGDLSLKEITEAGIDVLTRDNKKGFFFMIEGGRIDWGGHANDAAAAILEVIDMDEAIKVAFEFYRKHPKETLIVITADHETGGMTPGRGSQNLSYLKYQKKSKDGLSAMVNELVRVKEGKVSWEDIKSLLTETMGFWREVPISWENEKILRDAYESTLARRNNVRESNLYSENPLIVAKAIQIINDMARLGWATTSHSGGYVPVFAIGAGQELFTRKMDNTDIPKNIIKAARY